MGKPLIQFLSETSKACCQWGFMKQFAHLTNRAAAAKLGLSIRTVGEWRSMAKDGAFACRNRENCCERSCPNAGSAKVPNR